MLENEQIDKKTTTTTMQVLEEYITKILSSPILEECIKHMKTEEKEDYKQKILDYYKQVLAPKPYVVMFGSANPKLIAAHIIYKSLIPVGIKHLRIYGKAGSPTYSLITWRELGEILEKPNMTRSHHHYDKINIGQIPVDIRQYNNMHWLNLGLRRIEEDQKCPHCNNYIPVKSKYGF